MFGPITNAIFNILRIGIELLRSYVIGIDSYDPRTITVYSADLETCQYHVDTSRGYQISQLDTCFHRDSKIILNQGSNHFFHSPNSLSLSNEKREKEREK